jgi:hypothetical protein
VEHYNTCFDYDNGINVHVMISVNDKFILVTDLDILRIRRDVGANSQAKAIEYFSMKINNTLKPSVINRRVTRLSMHRSCSS